MSFGFGRGRKPDSVDVTAVVITVLFFAAIVGMILLVQNGLARGYRAVHGDATPDPAAVAESVGTSLYDGGDGRTTTRVQLLLTATGDSPETGLIGGPDEAVNYLYYTRTRRHVVATVMGVAGRISPVLMIIGPDGSVLARDDNDGGASKVELQADLPAEGHYTIRVSANMVDPNARSLNYSLDFATPGYYSPWEWEKLLELVPILVVVLIILLGLFGKLFGVPVKGIIEQMRWFVLAHIGISRPPVGWGRNLPQTALVLPPPPEDMPEFEIDPNELYTGSITDLYYGSYPEEEEDDDV